MTSAYRPIQRLLIALVACCVVLSGCSIEVTGEHAKERAATDAVLKSGTLQLSTTTTRAELAIPADSEAYVMQRSDRRPFTVKFTFPSEQTVTAAWGESVALDEEQETLKIESVNSLGVVAFHPGDATGPVTGYEVMVEEMPLQEALDGMQVLVATYGGDAVTGLKEEVNEAKRRGETYKRFVTTGAAGPVFLSMGLRFDENDSGAHVTYFVDFADGKSGVKGTSQQ